MNNDKLVLLVLVPDYKAERLPVPTNAVYYQSFVTRSPEGREWTCPPRLRFRCILSRTMFPEESLRPEGITV